MVLRLQSVSSYGLVVILLVWATGPRDWDLNFPGFERAIFKHIDEIIRSKWE
jgi:hypothetical protein